MMLLYGDALRFYFRIDAAWTIREVNLLRGLTGENGAAQPMGKGSEA
jgi:hypothetical protein